MQNHLGKYVYSVLIVVFVVAAFVAGWYFHDYRGQKQISDLKQAPVDSTLALSAVPVVAGAVPFTKNYVGFVTPIHEAEIQPYISGYLQKIFVEGGEYVKQGTILAVLQQDEYLAQMNARKADVVKAEAALQNANSYYERIQKAGVKAVSQTEIENAEAQFLEAKASLEQAKANLALAKVNFDYTLIRAPISGVVGNVALTPGNYVSPSSGTLFSIMQYSPIRVVFALTDKEYLQELSKPRPFAGDEVYVELANGQLLDEQGAFEYTDNAVERRTNAISIYALFQNKKRLLTPNAYVNVLMKRTFQNAADVTKSAVYLTESESYVYVIRNGRVVKQDVRILASEGSHFIVTNDFEPADYLIVQPIQAADVGKAAQAELQTKGQK